MSLEYARNVIAFALPTDTQINTVNLPVVMFPGHLSVATTHCRRMHAVMVVTSGPTIGTGVRIVACKRRAVNVAIHSFRTQSTRQQTSVARPRVIVIASHAF